MWDRLRVLLRWAWRNKVAFAGLVVLAIVGFFFVLHETSGPLSCSGCHEMGYEYRTWRVSSHYAVACDQCHYHPGVLGMVETKLRGSQKAVVHLTDRPKGSEIGPGSAHVPSRRCLECHKRAELPNDLTYHFLFHSHDAHLDRCAECTECHANVVHGGKAPFKNTPTMSSCLRCHDGEEAPNDCGLCHKKLGEIRPPLYNPEWVTHHKDNIGTTGPDRCKSCHGEDFCRSCHVMTRPPSHTASWVGDHEETDPDDRESCKECHQARGNRPEADFCTECHRARREHGTGYLRRHPIEFRNEPDACGRCHKETFCEDCHSIYMPHGSEWRDNHRAEAKTRRDSCRTCHEDHFCEKCHTEGRPASHTEDWTKTHPGVAKASADGCRECHPTNFCQGCHRKALPDNHRARTWIRAHGGTALANRAYCRACHDSDFCVGCHRGVGMPHPDGWLRSHPKSGVTPRACQACHAEAFCEACHKGTKPSSHVNGWGRRHGRSAKASKDKCMRCHSPRYCEVCHRIPMPHAKDIRATHAPVARGPNGRYCGLCHENKQCSTCHSDPGNRPRSHRDAQWLKQHGEAEGIDTRCALCHKHKFCWDCHLLPMPHSGNWLLSKHGGAAATDPETCARCHESEYCQTCHESTTPESHEADGFKNTHGAKREQEPLCALCHGRDAESERDACLTCHRGVQMPHDEGYALKHKKIGSFDSDGTCLSCHGLDHCKVCHADIPGAAN